MRNGAVRTGIFIILFIMLAFFVRRIPISRQTVAIPTPSTPMTEASPSAITVIAESLTIPWDIIFLPSNDMLVTQRNGTIALIGDQGITEIDVADVAAVGEGGLMGMTLHPSYQENNYLYLMYTTRTNGILENKVERFVLRDGKLTEPARIIDGIPGASNHNGGRIAFGPDGYLYIATGDAENASLAQDPQSLAGKILRIRDNGTIPEDNPLGTTVWSLGHRNPQGLAWDNDGNLWATEHGPSGLQTGYDEINRIIPGQNYGWPLVRGEESRDGLTLPMLQSGSADTWAPAGMAYADGSLYFGGLRGEALYEARIQPDGTLILAEHFKGQFGRIRAVALGPDGFLYLSTSNTDGRGGPQDGDDKIIRIDPSIIK